MKIETLIARNSRDGLVQIIVARQESVLRYQRPAEAQVVILPVPLFMGAGYRTPYDRELLTTSIGRAIGPDEHVMIQGGGIGEVFSPITMSAVDLPGLEAVFFVADELRTPVRQTVGQALAWLMDLRVWKGIALPPFRLGPQFSATQSYEFLREQLAGVMDICRSRPDFSGKVIFPVNSLEAAVLKTALVDSHGFYAVT